MTEIPKFLKVHVRSISDGVDKVDIKIPLVMVRMGMQMASLVPDQALKPIQTALKLKGVDFDLSQVNPEGADKLFASLAELDINVEKDDEHIRVYCE